MGPWPGPGAAAPADSMTFVDTVARRLAPAYQLSARDQIAPAYPLSALDHSQVRPRIGPGAMIRHSISP